MLRLQQLNTQVGSKQYEYVIIGAGLGGLYAGKLLAENGINNFMILEAQEGAGGRVETIKLGEINETNKIMWIKKNKFLTNFAIEKGATWLEESHTLMLHLASTMGIGVRKQFRDGVSTYLTKDRVYTSFDLMSNPDTRKSIFEFLQKFITLAKEYNDHVIDRLTIDDKYRQMVTKYDNMILTDYLKQEIESTFVRYFVQNFLEHIECLDLKIDSVHEIMLRAVKSEDIETLTEFLGTKLEPSYIINGGSEVFLLKFQEDMEKAAGISIQNLMKFNEEVVEIDNSVIGQVKVKSRRNGKVSTYLCKKVIVATPIGIMNNIKISNLSLAKRLILKNQTKNIVTKSFVITKRPFWRDKCTGDGLFSEDFNMSMSHDVSPAFGECGILVFFHCGQKYDKWHHQFPLDMPNRSEVVRTYYKGVLAQMYLEGDDQSHELDDMVYLNMDMMNNRFVFSGFQSNCKPGTLTALMELGEVFHKYYDDENGIVFIGSEFSEDFNSYMEGAVRSASKKIHSLLNKCDPVVELERKATERQLKEAAKHAIKVEHQNAH